MLELWRVCAPHLFIKLLLTTRNKAPIVLGNKGVTGTPTNERV
nr:MAG TPA: hypothetical protein [Caudoviricetes sp.]